MFNKILFPIDFSEVQEEMINYVTTTAEKFESQIFVLYVARDLTYFTELDVPHPSIYSFNLDIQKGAEKKMKDFCDARLQGKNFSSHILIGDPATEIVTFIEENEIDLVIMGTHGRQGLNRIVFGSMAEKIARNSPVPILIIKPPRKDSA
ncbi:MAG: universal stress protein [Deltaproteobacteria bacterium]|nr:universal stress protein [Deltaproteobacteria bacterium]MBW2050653.1 universal stress protein [Deltaproteobacteria bacterium]MBW2139453.1 universal stress protein [Deltaproteobacteria bacterium]MBW2324018.1 universal stress protein [Deltaproteobacteria bacterium]